MNQEQIKGQGYTQEQITRQAGCYRLLAYRVEQHFKAYEQLPSFMKEMQNSDEMIGFTTRMILDENEECLEV